MSHYDIALNRLYLTPEELDEFRAVTKGLFECGTGTQDYQEFLRRVGHPLDRAVDVFAEDAHE